MYSYWILFAQCSWGGEKLDKWTAVIINLMGNIINMERNKARSYNNCSAFCTYYGRLLLTSKSGVH